jgi:hypothetical protein
MQLTKHEQLVIGLVVALLLTGWAVKAFRAAHPGPAPSIASAHP